MTIVVTGATGFIGAHVVAALAAQGGEEIVAVSRHPVAPERFPAGVRHIALDIAAAEPDDFARLGSPDMLIHLAWGGLPNYLSLHHLEIELPAHFRFLKMMVEAGLPAMLVAGTCYEYGMVDGELEEGRAAAPANPYAFAKFALWRHLAFLQETHSFALSWARLFYTWGEGQAASSIYPLLRAAAERGDATFPMSPGEQLRDYLPVTEVADIVAALAMRRGNDGVVNVSSGKPIAIRTLVERWIAEEGMTIAPELGRYGYPGYEPLAFWGSSAKRRTLLDAPG